MLPRIKSRKQIVRPAVKEVLFDDKYIVGLGISRNPDGTQPCAVAFQAYNYDTKEISEDPTTIERMSIPDIWGEATRSTAFAQSLGGLVNVIMLLYSERTLRDYISTTKAGRERDLAVANFKDVQKQLGTSPEYIPPPSEDVVVWAHPIKGSI